MKGLAVVVVVVCLLAPAQAGWGANLDSSWYVKLGPIDLHGYTGGHETIVVWNFTGPVGAAPPFSVTNPDSWWPQREVSVPVSTTADPGTWVYLQGDPETPIDFIVTQAVFHYETNYDASCMRLDFLMQAPDNSRTLLWSQTASGLASGEHNVLGQFQSIPVGYSPIFRVIVVPEPSSFLSIAAGIALLAFGSRRARR